ncbi:SIR2 family protein [Maribacter sp. Hel_I_7]|uniref:SIR2 family protein n=1 Tax=Maribacter sp. Hel_I_7 TaxID=1249997 RepID=UPI00047B5A41|nr:SIR2 family protein [Maribacter sp. Hel_I_7]
MEDIYINGNNKVSIEYDNEIVSNVYIDGKKHEFENTNDKGKLEFALKTKRNKYKKFLNFQFENLLILTGAGSSVGIGKGEKKGRLLTDLWDDTVELVSEEVLHKLCELVHYTDKKDDNYVKNLEKLLSFANSAKEYVKDPEGKIDITELIKQIESLIKSKCELDLPNNSPHKELLEKITKRKVTLPRAKVFTLNYDTLFEQAGIQGNFTMIDGFSFSFPRIFSGRNFNYDIVQRDNSRVKEEDNFVSKVFHLYKPHGSVDWERLENGSIKQSEKVNKALMIYPKESKYESSYEQPFFEMMSRLQQNLRKDNVLLICIGFSFNDKHIVTAIQEALEQNPSFQLMVVNKGISQAGNFNKELYRIAQENSSIVLIDELFSNFSNYYPDLKTYNQDNNDKIVVNLNNSGDD